jgi:hypothetical protein
MDCAAANGDIVAQLRHTVELAVRATVGLILLLLRPHLPHLCRLPLANLRTNPCLLTLLIMERTAVSLPTSETGSHALLMHKLMPTLTW